MTPTEFNALPTPRTDAVINTQVHPGYGDLTQLSRAETVYASHARQLERELFLAESALLAIWQFCATQSPESGIAQKCLRTLAEVRNTK